MSALKLSVIIPCLNEANNIVNTLMRLQAIRKRGHEIIICDGGSHDNTQTLSTPLVDKFIHAKAGRAIQMNAAAKHANGDVLCFLHADTLTPETVDKIILSSLNEKNSWGFFSIKLSSKRWQFRIIEWFINKRSRISCIGTGDQGIFINAHLFKSMSGFAEINLMEDIELSKRLKKINSPVFIHKHYITTSSRRWEKHGILTTVFLMWKLRLSYFLGANENSLAKAYKRN